MRFDRGEFLRHVAFEDAAVVPAGYQFQMVARQDRCELDDVRGNLPPSSVPL